MEKPWFKLCTSYLLEKKEDPGMDPGAQATNLSLSPPQWQAISLTVIEKVQIAAAILGSLFLIASISWLIWSTFSPSAKWQRQDLLFQICYGMYGFMDVVCIGGSGVLSP